MRVGQGDRERPRHMRSLINVPVRDSQILKSSSRLEMPELQQSMMSMGLILKSSMVMVRDGLRKGLTRKEYTFN